MLTFICTISYWCESLWWNFTLSPISEDWRMDAYLRGRLLDISVFVYSKGTHIRGGAYWRGLNQGIAIRSLNFWVPVCYTFFYFKQLYFESRAKSCLIVTRSLCYKLLSSCLENFQKMLDSSHHNAGWKKDPSEKLFYRQVHSPHCVCGIMEVLLLSNVYISHNLDVYNMSNNFHVFA